MPEISEILCSDDEYEDAISGELSTDSPGTTISSSVKITNSKADVDEIIKQQTKLKLDDNERVNADSSTSSGNKDKNEVDVSPEYISQEIDENELKQKEESMSPEELTMNAEHANQLKLEANELFKNNQAEEAIEMYTEALKICPLKTAKERAVLYGNRAAAKIKLGSKKTAVDDCNKAIALWPEYVRVLLRRAKLYELEDKLDEALTDYKRVYELEPGQNEAREAMIRLPPIIEERNERLKAEMLDKLKDLGNMILKPFGLSTSNFQTQKDPNTGSYSINFQNNNS